MSSLLNAFPDDLLNESILRRGGAFKARHQFPGDDKPKNRFFFILNRDPRADTVLVLTTATTKISKREAVRSADVLVRITRAEYPDLDQDSIIDCESAMVWNKNELMARIRKKEIQPLTALTAAILERLVKAIAAAKTIPAKHKRLVIGREMDE